MNYVINTVTFLTLTLNFVIIITNCFLNYFIHDYYSYN